MHFLCDVFFGDTACTRFRVALALAVELAQVRHSRKICIQLDWRE